MKLNSLLAVKKFIRAHLYSKDESDPYVMAWKAAKLSVQPEEFLEKRADQEKKVSEKNKNVLTLSKTKVEEFYNSFLEKKNPDIVDKILALQATLGLRMIEVLSSKVSEFRKNGEQVEQVGTAKSKVGTAKMVSKTPIFIDSGKFMEIVGEVRKTTDKFKSLSNAEIVGKYNSRVNERILTYLKKVKIDHSELRSSHGLRRLYVAVAYMLKDDDKLTYHQFIKDSLGHESGGSVAHYNTIVTIWKDEEESKGESKGETKETKAETKETKETKEEASLSKATRVKYEVFKKAVAAGKTSYEELEKVKIPGTIPQKYLTRNIILKFKRMVNS
jgi:integrase